MFGQEIQIDKIKLRPIKKADLVVFVKGLSRPEVIRYLTLPKPPSMKIEIEWYNKVKKAIDQVIWTVEFNHQCIGSINLHKYNKFLKSAELGYQIHQPKYWGKGIGSKIAKAVTDYGFTELKLETIESGVMIKNIASNKILEKIGYKKYGVYPHKLYRDGCWHDANYYVLLRQDWLKKSK